MRPSNIQEELLILADRLKLVMPEAVLLLRRAAQEIELLKRVIVHEPIEPTIEEGDRANG